MGDPILMYRSIPVEMSFIMFDFDKISSKMNFLFIFIKSVTIVYSNFI